MQQNTNDVVVRFAPSPTGHLHIGGVRTALFNWLYAKSRGGRFCLRIEDTDTERSEKRYEDEIFDSLTWLGLTWDGEAIRQSARLARYRSVADELIAAGLAYKVDAETDAVMFTMPKEKVTVYDLVHGPVAFDTALFDNVVIIKSNGFPTYNFACVVDDYDQGITHSIRGDDHLTNTPKQLLLYHALGFKPPKFAHIPLIFGSDGTPLSKRHGATAVMQYKKQGYLPAGMVNYLALLGWGPQKNKELFSLQELTEAFSLKRLSKTNAIFDPDKLRHINLMQQKELSPEVYAVCVKTFLARQGKEPRMSDEVFTAFTALYQARSRTFQEFMEHAAYFLNDTVTYKPEAVAKYFIGDEVKGYLVKLQEALSQCGCFDDPAQLEVLVRACADEIGVKAAALIHPIRVALTGDSVSPGIFEIMALMGKEKVCKRLGAVIEGFEELCKGVK